MALAAGRRLGSLEIIELIGAGGMGEVYRARDLRLNRDVAVKVLPAALLRDAESRARFEREAQLLAALNHSNIAHIYGVEQFDDSDALVMELVEGQTLGERLARGPLPFDDALDIARQIADALDAAHERGIVHRDLKPANIRIRTDGAVKVLDFGLAKAVQPERGSSVGDAAYDPTNSPTMTSPAMTERGIILGTAGYMSPEQARGQAVDRRADIWAFGCVLYEMLTGHRAFTGPTTTDVIAAVVHVQPDLARVPERVRPLIQACLQKDPRRRLRDAGDMLLLLENRDPASPPTLSRVSRTAWIVGAALAAAMTLGAFAFSRMNRSVAAARMIFDLPTPTGFLGALLSPDGRFLLLGTQTPGEPAELVLRAIDSREVHRVPGTDGVTGAFWSPDSQTIVFGAGGALKKIAVTGGTPDVLVPRGVNGRGCWLSDGFIVMNTDAGISKVPLTGGQPVPVTVVDHARGEIHHELPACLADGRFLYFRHLMEQGASGIYIGDPRLAATAQQRTPVVVASDGPVLVPSADTERQQLLFMQDQTLFVQTFDVRRTQLVGQPTRVVGSAVAGGFGLFSASATGLLLYVDAPSFSRQLTWMDRNGELGASLGPVIRVLRSVRLAPNGSRTALGMFPQDTPVNNDDIWLLASGGQLMRLTSAPSVETSPVWSPDSTRLAYTLLLTSSPGLYVQTAEPGAVAEKIADTRALPSDWSHDGRFILLTSGGTAGDVLVAPAQPSDHPPLPLIAGPAAQGGAVFSPDGHWIAYLSNETGRTEVYVRRFDVSPDGTPSSPGTSSRVVSMGARGLLRWPRNGREILYMSADGRFMSVDVTLSPAFSTSAPRALFTFPAAYLRANPVGAGFGDISADGTRLLMAMPPADAAPPGLHVIVNWPFSAPSGSS
jgi:Tol biopolymer transport system component